MARVEVRDVFDAANAPLRPSARPVRTRRLRRALGQGGTFSRTMLSVLAARHVRRPGSVKVDGDGVVERAIGFDGKVRDVRKARSVELDDTIDKQAQSVEPFAVAHS